MSKIRHKGPVTNGNDSAVPGDIITPSHTMTRSWSMLMQISAAGAFDRHCSLLPQHNWCAMVPLQTLLHLPQRHWCTIRDRKLKNVLVLCLLVMAIFQWMPQLIIII